MIDQLLDGLLYRLHEERLRGTSPQALLPLEREVDRLVGLRARLTPLSPTIQVQRSEFLSPEDVFCVGDGMVMGRFAWSHLMRRAHAPWPEEALQPDLDFPFDAAPEGA